MALEYFLYTTLYNNTLVDRSDTTFVPLPPDTGQIHIDFLIPNTQPLYYYYASGGTGGTIALNDDATINAYLNATAPPPQPDDPTPVGVFTGYTAVTQTQFTGYSASTLADINTRVFRSGDTMTGSLGTSGNLTAVGAVTGSSLSASVLMTTPILNASTSISAPQITGSTCITSPISCATTRMQAPVVCASTCVISPITIGSSCLCSQGTTGLAGAVTAASTLNVSGVTTLGAQVYTPNINTGGTFNDYTVGWNPLTGEFRTIPTGTGGTTCIYCYAASAGTANNSTTTNASYIDETWTLSEGYYESEFNAVFGNTSANRCAEVSFLVNGNVVGSCNLMKTNAGVVRTTAYITQNGNLSGGTHQVQIVFRQIGGGISQVHYGAMRIQRIGETV